MAIQSLTDLKALINSTIQDNTTNDISGSDVQTALINAIDTLDSLEGFINVHKANGQTTITAYGSKALARAAVPDDCKKEGVVIAYKISTGWLIEQNLDATAGTWGDDASWQTIGPVSVSQNSQTGHTNINIGSDSYPVASADEAEKLKYNVDGVNNSYEFSLVASTGLSINLNSKMFAGNKYTMKMTTANTMVVYVRLDYADGTTEGANRATNEDITIIPSKDVAKLRLTASTSTDVVLTIKADSKFDDLNTEFSEKINGTDKIARLYPFTTSIDKTLTRPNYDTQVVYSKSLSGIQFLIIDTFSDEKFYISTLYSYGSQTSVLNIKNASDNIHFTYSAQRSSLNNRPVETLNLTADDNESTLKAVIDWSRINTATGQGLDDSFVIDESCIHRKQREFSITPYLDKTYNADNKAADAKTLGGIARLYPFICKLNTVLKRPDYDEQIVYSPQTAGILYLHIETSSKLDFFIRTLYAYGGDHRAYLTIYNSDNEQIFAYSSAERASSSSSSFPTETIEITASDGSTLKAIIDWSKINRATGLNLDETFTIDEACIHRIPADEDISKLIQFIPITDYYVTGAQQRIYMNELASYNPTGFFTFQATGNTGQEVISGWNGECQYLQFDVTSTKDITVTINYQYNYVAIATKNITVHAVVGATLPVKKYMFIGDSLTYAGVYEKKFYDMNPNKVVLYGTIGTAPYLCEGRYGWTSSDYINQASKGGLTNPFYNPNTQTFDFSYYMANNPSFADVDCVVIFLGRNDGYSSGSLISNINTMIASIKAFNNNIKAYVIGAYNVACNDSGTGKYLQSHALMNHIGFNYNRNRFFATFTPETETKPIPVHLNLDNKYDYSSTTQDVSVVDNRQMEVYTDNVHPSSIGYEKFGMAINGFFHYEFRQV